MVTAAGIDTWSPCWRIDGDSAAARALDALATTRTKRGRMLPEPVAGHRVVWFDSARLLAAEGHPAGEGSLASPNGLPDALASLTEGLQDVLGASLPGPKRFAHSSHGFEGIRRLDATVNLAPGSGARGLAILAGIAATRPRGLLSSRVRRAPGGRAIETIDWLGARGIVARAYDKGVEANLAPRGELLRLEDQRRWPSGHRRDVEELDVGYVCDSFRRRFEPLMRASKGLVVVAMEDLAEKLAELVREGEITPLQAKRAFAHLGFESIGVHLGSRMTRYRDRQLVDRLGLVVADGVLEGVEVDLSGALAAALSADAWDRAN